MLNPAASRACLAAAALAAIGALWAAAFAGTTGAQSTAPAAPTITNVIAGEQSLTVDWEPAADSTVAHYDLRVIETSAADKADDNWYVYDLEQRGTSDIVILVPQPTVAGSPSYANGTSYDVQVRADAGSNAGDWSVTVTGTPAEAGRTTAGAASIVPGLPVKASLSSYDIDYWEFTLTE